MQHFRGECAGRCVTEVVVITHKLNLAKSLCTESFSFARCVGANNPRVCRNSFLPDRIYSVSIAPSPCVRKSRLSLESSSARTRTSYCPVQQLSTSVRPVSGSTQGGVTDHIPRISREPGGHGEVAAGTHLHKLFLQHAGGCRQLLASISEPLILHLKRVGLERRRGFLLRARRVRCVSGGLGVCAIARTDRCLGTVSAHTGSHQIGHNGLAKRFSEVLKDPRVPEEVRGAAHRRAWRPSHA